MQKMFETLEFTQVLEMLAECALSENAKSRIIKLKPYRNHQEVSRHLAETSDARQIIEIAGTPPLAAMQGLTQILATLGKGGFLFPEQLSTVANFLTACRRMKGYLKKMEGASNSVAYYGQSICDLTALEDTIHDAVRENGIDDKASSQLADLRRKIIITTDQMKAKLDALLRHNKTWFSEGFVAVREGHYTLPVKKEFKNQVNGRVMGISQSGATYFVEPTVVSRLHEELGLLHLEEENEIRRILYTLTTLVEENLSLINLNVEAMEILDFIFAKAKLSIDMKAIAAPVEVGRKIVIKAGRHPLLDSTKVVPLDFTIGDGIHGVVITGPNTGGKTVALKTIGLLSLMAGSGLHVPASEGSCFALQNYVLCDIGDQQSIAENLSTFSSHLVNIIEILKIIDETSLVLLDELGSGTDPTEGMGLAVSILEELVRKNSLFVVTTHYPEIKEFTKATPGLVNARMTFDLQSLSPLYRLEMGEAGESCALYIAERLGLPQRMIERARAVAYEKTLNTPNDEQWLTPIVENQSNAAQSIASSQQQQASKKIVTNERYQIGDCVVVYPQKQLGIVYQIENAQGEIGVQIQKKKQLINHKRLKLRIPAQELYPENYDFSIIFDTVENRKARHTMARKHDPKLIIEMPNDPQ